MNIVIGIACFVAALVVGASFIRDLMRTAYLQGRKDADAWWLRAIKDVDQTRQEISKEEGAGWP